MSLQNIYVIISYLKVIKKQKVNGKKQNCCQDLTSWKYVLFISLRSWLTCKKGKNNNGK